jgi:hypothetical protein
MEPTDNGDTVRPIDEPNAGGQRSVPEAPPAAAPANHVRSGDPETQQVVQKLRKALERRYIPILERLPDWTREQLVDLWPSLADADRSRQYELRKVVGTLDRFRLAMRTVLRRRDSEIAIKRTFERHAARYPELPWSHLASQESIRKWLLDQADRSKTSILRQLGIDVFPATAEPWVPIDDFARMLRTLWPQPRGSQANYRSSRKSLYSTIAAPPAEWFVGWTLKRTLVPEIADPFKIVGITTQWGRAMWAIRLGYLKPGRLREALEPIWQARAAQYWVEQEEMAQALKDKSQRTKQRFHMSSKRRTPERKRLVLEHVRRMLALGRHETKELCETIQRLYGIALTPRMMLNYKREAVWMLQRERAQSAPPSDTPGPAG